MTDQTSRVSGTYEFTGPAEVVFGVLTDPDRAARWLPAALGTESVSTSRVTVAGGRDYPVTIEPDRLRVSWGEGGTHGQARVEDAPAGGSVLHAEVTAPVGEQAARELLDETVRNLRSDVSDNFNAG
ncbi:uncharacterized protein YndB with AHSA1/START domain [Actinoplanes octamycinicus]|uniref:Uncharacterized protein YndB with AHSA1/START domain n=1 Tax=Actinoplanes octamycinicus TaxID=135948 RepID=A0A7W7MB52_9ACTN|nr:hypothetical protein [Actinoplanes octamycinicus]MBB4743748.1 uncharacterized protein YndB with AHSA1/START domain [Actinoplanes octamycinicus]GIE61178.1 hypothetical protein Aoc01nite_65800 [Actinoplanes octamycinicus]